jgi:hypothetical protein
MIISKTMYSSVINCHRENIKIATYDTKVYFLTLLNFYENPVSMIPVCLADTSRDCRVVSETFDTFSEPQFAPI